MKIYLDNNLGVTKVEQEELTQDTIGYNILKVYIPNAVLTPYDTFTCYYGALLQNGRKVGWFAMEARTSTDADYEENYTLYKATLEQCVVSVEGKVYIGCQILLGNSGNATLIKKNTAVVQFNVRKSVAINNDILVLDTDQTTTDVLESYKNLLKNALTTYATKATTYTKTEVNSALALKADKSDTYTKTQVDALLAPKVAHDGNQLKDSDGNNIYPNLDDQQVGLDNLNRELCEISDNLLDIENVSGVAIDSGVASYDSNTNKLTISGTPSSSQSINIYMVNGALLSDYTSLLKAGTYYLKMSSGLSNYTFTINFKTVKNGTITNVFSKYAGTEWEFTLSEDTYFYRIEIIVTSGNTYNFDGYIWLNKTTSKDYQSPKAIFVNPSYLENRLTPIETSVENVVYSVYRDSTNLMPIKNYDGNAVNSEYVTFDYSTQILTISGTPSSNTDFKLYPTASGTYVYPELKKGKYYLNFSKSIGSNYTFTINFQTIKNGVTTTNLTKYSGNNWEFELTDDTYFYRVQVILNANVTFNFSGYVWLCYSENKTYEKPETQYANVIMEKPKVRPTILFNFDAPSVDNRDTLLRQYGFRGTYNFNFEGNNNYGFTAMQTLIQNGHDIGLYRGGDIDSTPDWNGDWDSYIALGLSRMKLKGYYLPTVFGCRGLKSNAKLNEACKKYNIMYVSSIINQIGDDSYTYYNVANNTPYTFNICPWGMHQQTLEATLNKIDEAVANNYILPLFTHLATGGDGNISEAYFISVLQKVKELYDNGKVDVLTYREFYNKYHKENGAKRDYDRVMSIVIGDHTPTYNE